MLDEKIKFQVAFGDELSKWLDKNLPPLFEEVISHNDDDLDDLYNDDVEPLITLEKDDVIVSERRIRAKIAEAILENHIQDRLFEIEYHKSASTQVIGYD